MRRKAAARVTAQRVPPAPPAFYAFRQSRWPYIVVSLLLLVPCYWQPRIEAGDLSSHIYNAWLAQLIESGRAQGLMVVWQSTNVLFDLVLASLFKLAGADAAQRLSVSLAVLVFFWGAFAFAAAVGERRPWPVAPCLAILTYGWVYHMGFFNFYLSLGLSLWALALLWKPSRHRLAAAIPILALAYLAHALPVVWAVCLAAYLALAARLSPKSQGYLLGGSLLAMVALHFILGGMMITLWSPQQIKWTTGLDQVWVFDSKYGLVLVGLLMLWGMMFIDLLRRSGFRQVIASMAFQFCLISAAGAFILPEVILPPGYLHALGFIAERQSLCVAICICALLAAARPNQFERYVLIFVALVFFGFLYHDERAMNSFEDRMLATIARLPAGQRVISAIQSPNDLRVDDLPHMIDRVCIGHCYSYANYEPSTAQFRVRVNRRNEYQLDLTDTYLMQMGRYLVKQRDLPLYQVDLDGSGQLVINRLPAGFRCGSTVWNVLGD